MSKHSEPIPISSPGRGRFRSGSMSSASSGSASSSEVPTPMSVSGNSATIPSPGSSPILSYFLAQSPSKSPATSSFPFRKFTAPVFEEEEEHKEPPAVAHARRASTAFAGRLNQQPPNMPDSHVERGAGVLRRLSLSSTGFMKSSDSGFSPQSPPSVPPNSAVSPVGKSFAHSNKPRRSATVSEKPRRAPSPMGERMLKGHFDGFN